MDTCIETDCTKKSHARGLCAGHYGRHRKAGTLDKFESKQSQETRHILTNKDTTLQTADCQLCGHVPIVTTGTLPSGNPRWKCGAARKTETCGSRVYRFGADNVIPREVAREARTALLASQDGVCAICGTAPAGQALALDHCHDTGKIRGLLCKHCNLGLGLFKDDTTLLTKAREYLTA